MKVMDICSIKRLVEGHILLKKTMKKYVVKCMMVTEKKVHHVDQQDEE
mgnify:CR=1 FL=1